MTILYIETNFLMAIAKGQDPEAENLLYNPPNEIRIFIPNICYVEAVSVFKIEKQVRESFKTELEKKIKEAKRDLSSANAISLINNLEQAKIDNDLLLDDIQYRLSSAIDGGNSQANSLLIPNVQLQNTCRIMLTQPETLLVKNDIMDNLIIRCILNHADSHSQEEKAFISNNSKDFSKPEVKEVLSSAGITYFTMTQHFLDWFNSRSST
ncbi:PIN domain-containing protein [Okeanomitos corallinicola TIOX110]|uniref:PIN domain-containing protein n=1 Tax=Okeanomitos corallinicola TIOX110 TaxID=3133117 RepID=A0ABZ2UWT0_9CYAN